jgi:hypothetical protein
MRLVAATTGRLSVIGQARVESSQRCAGRLTQATWDKPGLHALFLAWTDYRLETVQEMDQRRRRRRE